MRGARLAVDGGVRGQPRMLQQRWKRRIVLVRSGLVIVSALCWWGGYDMDYAAAQVPRIQGQGTAASAMGNAFAAQADDASALHYNAAGMTQLRPG